MPAEMVRNLYDDGSVAERILCLSHERLRHELAGAESLLDSGAAKIARLEVQVKQQQLEIMDLRTELARERVL
jgi:hypothetical protein